MMRLLLWVAVAAWAQAPAPPVAPQTATIAAGRVIAVRTAELSPGNCPQNGARGQHTSVYGGRPRALCGLSSKLSHKDDVFIGKLDQRLMAEGVLVADRGARCEG